MRYKVQLDDLYSANAAVIGTDKSLIVPGMKLNVPGQVRSCRKPLLGQALRACWQPESCRVS